MFARNGWAKEIRGKQGSISTVGGKLTSLHARYDNRVRGGVGHWGESKEVMNAGGIAAEAILSIKAVKALKAEKDFYARY